MRRALAVLLVLAMPLGAAGCGGDDEGAEKRPKAPELTVPQTDTETETAPPATDTAPPAVTTPPQPPATGGGDGGATAPAQPPDGPQNDTPPPPGSEAERYERFCDENPGACG